MSVTLTLDAHGVTDPQEAFLRTINTRIAGGGRLAATATPPRVVVDVREFRSSLPSLLHGRNMIVIPCMLTVGDYVLSPTICVERKSIKDLISSLNSGRLYSQAETMLLHYQSPMLLIEFDQSKSFTLEPFASVSSGNENISHTDLQSKIVLLTLAFPRLKIIWSSSPFATAEIFEELKKQQDEPDAIKAVQVGLQPGEEADIGTGNPHNQTAMDMLLAVPGVTGKNVDRLVRGGVRDMRDLSTRSLEELGEIIGVEAARTCRRFFDRDVFEDV
jgi:DNA excision repair protein ERCC-4